MGCHHPLNELAKLREDEGPILSKERFKLVSRRGTLEWVTRVVEGGLMNSFIEKQLLELFLNVQCTMSSKHFDLFLNSFFVNSNFQ